MRKDNPAVFECTKNPSGIHAWIKNLQGAKCLKCSLQLNKKDANDVFRN